MIKRGTIDHMIPQRLLKTISTIPFPKLSNLERIIDHL
jgi:hypothetical protein